MEKKIEIEAGKSLEDVVNILLDAKEKGERAFCEFNGHILHSNDISMDSAFLEVVGCTKAEHDQKIKDYLENYEQEIKSREEREEEYLQKVEDSRGQEKIIITKEAVINGLKYIAENQNTTQDELIDGLLQLGCNFTLDDINDQFPESINLIDGMKTGALSCGATVIANMRDSDLGRDYGTIRFLNNDNDTSIYHFIRILTGDETYTKENIDISYR
ncbi:MAG: hypothetical protein IJI22_00135 [Bacilli bacterium]|nr:hypothetical protein [Bacilli bacterium]